MFQGLAFHQPPQGLRGRGVAVPRVAELLEEEPRRRGCGQKVAISREIVERLGKQWESAGKNEENSKKNRKTWEKIRKIWDIRKA